MHVCCEKPHHEALKMGGNAFKSPDGKQLTQQIKQDQIPKTIEWLEGLTGLPLTDYQLGSTGQKPMSGDIDLVVDATKVEKAQLSDTLSQAVLEQGQNPKDWIKKTGESVHFRSPIMGNPKNGFVQVDFMFFEQPDFAKFMFRQDADSTYRGASRNVLINSIAKSLNYKLTPNQGITDRETGKLVTNDPEQIAKLLLGSNATIDELGSVEKILDALKDDPERESKLAAFREYADKQGIVFEQNVENVDEDSPHFLARLRDRIVNHGMQVIVENARIDHPEDLVFDHGSAGLQRAVDGIKSIVLKPENTTVKWDGMPAIIFGRKPTGEFILTDKSGFSSKSYDGLATSPEHIKRIMDNRKGDRTELVNLYANLFPMLEKTIPKDFEGYVKGDLLFSARPPVVDGAFEFTPNTVTYRIPTDGELGKKVASSRVGIAIHTYMPYPGGGSKPITSDVLQPSKGVLILDPSIKEPRKITLDEKSFQNIEKVLANRSGEIDRLFDPQELRSRKITNLPALMKQYINSRVRDGSLDNLISEFPEWVKQKETPGKVSRIFEWLQENKYGLVSAMRSFAEITKLKNDVVRQLDGQANEVTATINGKPGHEGYVNDGLKFVDRMRFSAANFQKNAGGIS